ncbi:MAG: 3'(2'),5'-bisphosphate nucleotidase CysQ, partial [Gammaproteobacteria bacterium]|nr:3'(2'),5'-bisphosphate nucleotidase CysQ [Gammaproteobacteria bacterium]
MKELINQVLTIAEEAGAVILDIYHGAEDIGLTLKEDNTPLTRADLAANELIRMRLDTLRPQYPIL